MKCAACGHHELEHLGLACNIRDCDCRGFESPEALKDAAAELEGEIQWRAERGGLVDGSLPWQLERMGARVARLRERARV